MSRIKVMALAALMALVGVACGGGDDSSTATTAGDDETTTTAASDKGKVVIGAFDFTESAVIANLYASALEHEGYEVEIRGSLGKREVVVPALEKGEIDLLPEYAGTALEFLNGGKGESGPDLASNITKLTAAFAAKNIEVLDPAPAVDVNALVVTKETADKHKLRRTSDLAAVSKTLVLGGPPECPERPYCALGYKKVYGLDWQSFKALDAGGPLTKGALEKGDIDVAVLFSSDGGIVARGFVLLEDDKQLQPADNIVPVARKEIVTDDLKATLKAVSDKLTTAELSELNKLVDVDKQDPAEVAEKWLADQGLT